MAIASITIASKEGERAVISADKIPAYESCADDIWVMTANDTHVIVIRAAFPRIGGVLHDMLSSCDPPPDKIGRIVLHAKQARNDHIRTIVKHALEGTPYHCFRRVANAVEKCMRSPSSAPFVAEVTAEELRSVRRVVEGISDEHVPHFDRDRIARSLERKELFETAESARYLSADDFLASCCRSVAERISGMSTEEMKRFFDVPDSEAVPKEVVRQNGWETWS